MKERIGEEFEGHISGLTEWGVYVELDDLLQSGQQQVEIELPFLEVGALDADAHGVAQGHAQGFPGR